MECRHVWSLPNAYATVAHCLRCGEICGLRELLDEARESLGEDLGGGPDDAEIDADFARLRQKLGPYMASPQVHCHCGKIPLQGFGAAIKDGVRHTAEGCD